MSKSAQATAVLSSFGKQFVAFVKGDDAEVKAAAAHRQALAAVNASISQLEGDLVDKELTVVDKNEHLAGARVNFGEAIKDRPEYIRILIASKEAVNTAEEELAEHLRTIDFLKAELKLLQA